MGATTAIDIKLTGLESLNRMRAFLDPKTIDKAMAGGVRYAAKAAGPAVAKQTTSYYNIKSGRVKDDTRGPYISNGGQSAQLYFSTRPPTLNQFGFRPGTRGRQAGMGRGLGWAAPSPKGKAGAATIVKGLKQSYPGTFMLNGLPFRQGKGGKLTVVYGPSIGKIYMGKGGHAANIQSAVDARINEQFVKGFQRVLDSASRGY